VDATAFRWPVHGRIISSFGASPSGNLNEGINLAVPEGTIIKAAEAGTVLYSGDGVEGYGKLVLIRHGDGWVSAYAHNSEIRVNKGDAVSRGQTIAAAGNDRLGEFPAASFRTAQRRQARQSSRLPRRLLKQQVAGFDGSAAAKRGLVVLLLFFNGRCEVSQEISNQNKCRGRHFRLNAPPQDLCNRFVGGRRDRRLAWTR
jgi:hypothetical protein